MRSWPEWVPTAIRMRAERMGLLSVRKIEEQAHIPNGKLRYLYEADTKAIVHLVSLLKTLGYQCNSPEFDVINEFCSQNMVEICSTGDTISTRSETQNVYVLCNERIRSTYIGCAA